jgi:hypothetical protein
VPQDFLRQTRLAFLDEADDLHRAAAVVTFTIRASEKGHRAMYSVNRCMPVVSPHSLRTESSMLNPGSIISGSGAHHLPDRFIGNAA